MGGNISITAEQMKSMSDGGVENLLMYIVNNMEPDVRAIYEQRMEKILAARAAAAQVYTEGAPGGP